MDAGAGADIDDIIREPDRILVMLDDDHRVADVAQMDERFEKARIVALMQADRRLVEHIEHAGEARADLRGEPDALAFAAGQRARHAREIEIVEADIDEEFQPGADLLEDARGDLAVLRLELWSRASVNQLLAARIDISETWPICSLSILTARACGFRR